MSDLGQMLRVPAIRFERLLPGGATQVWTHLTECAKLTGWYGDDSTIEPREGGQVRLMGGHIRGVVTQWVPEKKLAHTWNVFAPGEALSPLPESYVTLELEPEAAGVRLALTHLPVLERFESQNAMGWHTFLDILEATLNARPIEPRAAYMQRNAALYGVDLANLQR
jgi:uncharacterized protein YndB with AHSA1/START domain